MENTDFHMSDKPEEVQATVRTSGNGYYQHLNINLSADNLLDAAQDDSYYTAPPESLKSLLHREKPEEHESEPQKEKSSVINFECDQEVTEMSSISERCGLYNYKFNFHNHSLTLSDNHADNMELLVSLFFVHCRAEVARKRLDFLFDHGSYSVFNSTTTEGNELVSVLLDLLNYTDGELCLCAAQLLYGMHSKESILLTSVRDVYLVTPSSSVFLKKVLPLACMSDEDKILHKMLRGEVQPEGNPHLLNTLDELCQQCVSEDDENEPATIQQSILYSSGESEYV